MAVQYYIEKSQYEKLPYTFFWDAWLSKIAPTETIASSTWDVPGGITKVSSTNDTVKATVVLSGGVVDNTYECINNVTTSSGYIGSRILSISVVKR